MFRPESIPNSAPKNSEEQYNFDFVNGHEKSVETDPNADLENWDHEELRKQIPEWDRLARTIASTDGTREAEGILTRADRAREILKDQGYTDFDIAA